MSIDLERRRRRRSLAEQRDRAVTRDMGPGVDFKPQMRRENFPPPLTVSILSTNDLQHQRLKAFHSILCAPPIGHLRLQQTAPPLENPLVYSRLGETIKHIQDTVNNMGSVRTGIKYCLGDTENCPLLPEWGPGSRDWSAALGRCLDRKLSISTDESQRRDIKHTKNYTLRAPNYRAGRQDVFTYGYHAINIISGDSLLNTLRPEERLFVQPEAQKDIFRYLSVLRWHSAVLENLIWRRVSEKERLLLNQLTLQVLQLNEEINNQINHA
ncbi:hypothetical protein J6590_053152 [Homalodisca vitripennis]|nr:hypothetical protein J6590_053152 [Homalodisca vitripennis]